MNSPFFWLPNNQVWVIFTVLVLLTVGTGYYLDFLGKKLVSDKIPQGILEIEVPWSEKRASNIVQAWDKQGVLQTAKKQTYWDFIFLILYPLTLSLACAWLAGSVPAKLSMLGIMVSWTVLLSGPLDALENIAILRMLEGGYSTPIPQLVTICASLKFTLILGATGYLVIGGVALLIQFVRGG